MRTILIIEDEEAVRDNLVEILEAEGFRVLGAEDGQIGVQLAREHQPDLILCDVMMPELNGYEVLQLLRQSSETATIPFIFLSAKVDRADLRLGMEIGADDYIPKPCMPDELLRAIATRLEKQETMLNQFGLKRQQAEQLAEEVEKLQRFAEAKDNLLSNLSQELRNPLSNINMAIRMLKDASSEKHRDRYLQILQDEFDREIALLNQVAELQRFLTPENVTLLRQFNLLKG